MEELVKANGFESVDEFHHLISYADLSSADKLKAFIDWKENDGSREGLLRLPQCAINPNDQTPTPQE